VNRAAWQQLAEERIEDAGILLAAGRWSAAYYLAGYAVECGLKACILAYVEQNPDVIFRERRFSEKCWTHDIDGLVSIANLETVRVAETAANPAFYNNWNTAKDWREADRYNGRTETDSRELYTAISDPTNGVLQWIRNHW
jgi:hypothetical protein